MVGLYEVKTSLNISFAGYVSYSNINRDRAHRGGTAVLVRNHLVNLIASVDMEASDQIWITFHKAPNINFGFCYAPPSD